MERTGEGEELGEGTGGGEGRREGEWATHNYKDPEMERQKQDLQKDQLPAPSQAAAASSSP